MKRVFIIIIVIILLLLFLVLRFFNVIPGRVYYAEDFSIEVIKSNVDYDNDGIDDYTDILNGAIIDANNKPVYRSAYYSGGYPPEDEGVCTDLIWRSFQNAGYNLKDLVDKDIEENISDYPRVNGSPDPNIDFRRVPNLKVFFERNTLSLTTDLNQIEEWMPGDIVIFGDSHIAIISDKRNSRGIPYIIHNAGRPKFEEDFIEIYNMYEKISGHYRFIIK